MEDDVMRSSVTTVTRNCNRESLYPDRAHARVLHVQVRTVVTQPGADLALPPDATPSFDGPVPQGAQTGIVPGLIWAFRIDEEGNATPLDVDQPI